MQHYSSFIYFHCLPLVFPRKIRIRVASMADASNHVEMASQYKLRSVDEAEGPSQS